MMGSPRVSTEQALVRIWAVATAPLGVEAPFPADRRR
jgi:hypothetical protein